MHSHLVRVIESVEAPEELKVPELGRKKTALNLAAVFLFALSLIGLWQISIYYVETSPNPSVNFFVIMGLTFFSLLLLSIVLVEDSKLAERWRLGTGFQSRVDQLQNKLEYREDMIRLISNHQASAITIFDRQNRFFFVNDVAAKRLGRPVDEVIGQVPSKILLDAEARRLEIRLAEARASDEPREVVDRISDGKGGARFMQRYYAGVSELAEMAGFVIQREDDLTNLIVERERREQMLRQVIDTLVAVVDRRDPYATGHSLRVGQLSKAIAGEMGLEPIQVEAAEIAGSLMNFGKVLVSRRILTKTSALTPEELQRVRDSILVSADILAIIGFDGPVVPTLRQVLERYDGTGVPEKLKGDDILITARIVAASNAFVAFVSPRAHRDGLSFKEALSVMANDSGKAYDERVLVAMAHYIENRPNKIDWLMVKQ
ncbi:MAG: hypothetical protein EOM37_04235 [Proteobacteria bacterium]|jgi:HD-GYP domain-containing protein (c-di-GMP phosphodiesterase class II)|nr:HD domain-containing phosphohydrolase [Alphaproteobacteria bacterium]NCC03242.1 hypothetical protein [Pseudomonadota bacterium]